MYCMEEQIFITSTHWSCLLFASVIYLCFLRAPRGKHRMACADHLQRRRILKRPRISHKQPSVFRFHVFFENSVFFFQQKTCEFNMCSTCLNYIYSTCLNYKDTNLFNMFEINSSLLKPVLLVYMYDVHDTIGMVLASIRTKLNSGRVGIMWFCDWVTVRLDSQRNQFFNVFDIDS